MSISVDDSGAPYPENGPIPLDELRALSWMDLHARHTTRYPDLGKYLEEAGLADLIAEFDADAATSDVPADYLAALRTGSPEGSYTVVVDDTRVRVAVLLDRTTCAPDPDRENESWQQLRDIVATTTCAGIVLDLPQELALAVWTRDGQEIWACRPGTPTGALRKARQRRRRLTALSPLPLLGAFGQAVTGGTCAASFAVAPVVPAMPLPDSDAGAFSRPPAAAAHPFPQRSWPLAGSVVRGDAFLPPVAGPDFVEVPAEPEPEQASAPAPAASSPSPSPSPAASTSSDVPVVSPTEAKPSVSPTPDGGSPRPETPMSVPATPDSPAEPGEASGNEERAGRGTELPTGPRGEEHQHRPHRGREHGRAHR